MRRFVRPTLGLALAAASLAAAPAPAGPGGPKALGTGPAYKALGALAVLHEGRPKPLDTMAREEVKSIFGRESIKLRDAKDEVVETWDPVAAVFDWSSRPEVWDDRPIILVEYVPLKRRILAETIREALEKVPAAELKAEGIEAKDVTATQLRKLAAGKARSADDAKALDRLADALAENHKWFTPNMLEEAKVLVGSSPVPFERWARSLAGDHEGEMGNGEHAHDEVDTKATEVFGRLVRYQSLRDRSTRFQPLLVMPRPIDAGYLKFSAEAYRKALADENADRLTPMQLDAANTLHMYHQNVQAEDRAMPGEDAKFDAKFTSWLRDKSPWVPIQVLLGSDPAELARAGYPAEKVEAFRSSHMALVQAEQSKPGEVDAAPASAFVASARDLAAAASPGGYYPTADAVRRELRFNEDAPFYKAPWAYGLGLALLALSLGLPTDRRSGLGWLGAAVYGAGMLGFVGGIGLEAYGFVLRCMISNDYSSIWAPVSNMYETVVWVGLVAAVLGLVFEAIYRRKYAATAASGVALLATVLAANVSLMDPNIKPLQPVLKSNYWLAIHVLTEVSSYAAFALAMGLGLIGTLYYLTATYRNRADFASLVTPLVPGLPLLAVGGVGVMAAQGSFGASYANDGAPFYILVLTYVVGVVLTGAGLFGPLGEALNRLTFRPDPGPSPSFPGDPAPVAAAASDVPASANPIIAEIRARSAAQAGPAPDARALAMQATAAKVKPLANYIYRTMQVGVLLIAAGTILGGIWADYSWGRFWGWDPKEVWALITLLVYLVPLHGRFAGWVNTFTLTAASVVCFSSVVMAWYGVNFVLGVGLHSYGFSKAGGQGVVITTCAAVISLCVGAGWRRHLASRREAELA